MEKPDPYGEWVLQKVQLETGGKQAPIPEEVLTAARATWPRIVIHATREFERQGSTREAVALAQIFGKQYCGQSLVAQTAVLDLRSRSVTRSPEPNPEEQPLELHHGFSQLNIYLPLGSPEGVYEVRIVTTDGDALLNISGTARLKDGITSLQVRGKPFLVRHGQCTMQIRKPPAEWSSYPLVLR